MPISAYIVSSGSMEPAIRTGSVVVVAPKVDYTVTDIVTYYSGRDKKTTTTHRIVAASEGQFKMMGDANDQPDPTLVPADKVIGSVRFSIPFLGYLAAQAKTPQGFILLVIVPATIIIYEELKSLFLELKKMFGKHKERAGVMRTGAQREAGNDQAGEHLQSHTPNAGSWFAKPAIILPIFFALLIPLTLSISYFIDRETSSGNSFTGTTPPPEEGRTIVPVEGASAPIPANLSVQQLIGATPTPTVVPTPKTGGLPPDSGSTLSLEETPVPTPIIPDIDLPTPTPTPDPNQLTTPAPTPGLNI